MRMPEDLNVSPATNSCATGKQTRASLLKIKMMMRPAPRIEPRAASRTTRLAAQILPNRQLRAASPAQNRPLLPLAARPNRNRMPRQRNMAILASVVHAAALHLDCDNIRRRVIVHTPRLQTNSELPRFYPNGNSLQKRTPPRIAPRRRPFSQSPAPLLRLGLQLRVSPCSHPRRHRSGRNQTGRRPPGYSSAHRDCRRPPPDSGNYHGSAASTASIPSSSR